MLQVKKEIGFQKARKSEINIIGKLGIRVRSIINNAVACQPTVKLRENTCGTFIKIKRYFIA